MKVNIKDSTFKILKDFLNSMEIGQEFTRQDYISCSWDITSDVYRKGLQDAGFIERVGYSKYRKVKDIPDYIKSSNYRNKKFLEKIEIQNKLKLL